MNHPNFEYRCDLVDVTMDGRIPGTQRDTYRRFIPGAPHWLIDGEEVSREEFDRRLSEVHADGEPCWCGWPRDRATDRLANATVQVLLCAMSCPVGHGSVASRTADHHA